MNPIISARCSSLLRLVATLAGLTMLGLARCPSVRAQNVSSPAPATAPAAVPVNTPPPAILTTSQIPPEYTVPYGVPKIEAITEVMVRVRTYLETATPARFINRRTREEITDFSKPDPDAMLDRGENNAFPLLSYENGVTFAGMQLAAEVTGDSRFAEFTARRYQFIADRLPYFELLYHTYSGPAAARGAATPGQPGREMIRRGPTGSVVEPQSLDDCGAMCAAMIKARRAGIGPDMTTVIDRYMERISKKQFRLADGTLARTTPQPETLWLDDMYMSIPALAQMGKLTGEGRYYDDAVKQVLQFSARMFNRQKGLFMHGWSSNTPDHPEFYWGRANGWAVMAMVELLTVLPEDHPQRGAVLEILRAHLHGLASYQSGSGLWHQLLDRNDSYLETSATAMYVFAMARAVNRGWVSPVAYGPAAQLGWNALTTKVNAKGQVEDTCVGTGMAFDPAYYYFRPKTPYAQHGYGPVLMAGSEMILMLKNDSFSIMPGIIQYVPRAPAKQ